MNVPSGTAARREKKMVVDAWYADAMAGPDVEGLDLALRRQFSGRLGGWLLAMAERHAFVRGVVWFTAVRDAPRIMTTFAASGLIPLLVLECLWPRQGKRIYLVEFLRPEPENAKGRIKECLHRALFRVLLPQVLAGAQVMTLWEIQTYAYRYRLAPHVFHYIPFPMMRNASGLPERFVRQRSLVLASGRAACDWVTLFGAADGADWDLTVICSAHDRGVVDALNAEQRATVLCEISAHEHERLLSEATVYALVLKEQQVSSGQVRLARAIEAGIPVVATTVLGLVGYLEHGQTGLAVPVADVGALRVAIDTLVTDHVLHEHLRNRAYDAMQPRSLENYIGQIQAFLTAGFVRQP